MTHDPTTPSELWHEARQLLDEAAEGGGDVAGRQARAEALQAASSALAPQADANGQDLLADAARFLEAVIAVSSPPPPTTLVEMADNLGWRILDLAERVAAGEIGPEDGRRGAAGLRAELEQLERSAEGQGEGPAIKSMMHDPRLELHFVEMGGNGPTSIRMAHRRR